MKALFILPDTDQTHVGAESARLLVSGAPWRGVLLDLYGSASLEHGYEVDDVALKGSPWSLVEWFSAAELAQMSAWCDDHLPTGQELRALDRAESDAPWLARPRRHMQ